MAKATKAKAKSNKETVNEFLSNLSTVSKSGIERPKGLKTVVSGAGYWDFKKNPVFQGHFMSPFLSPKDIPANKTKKGDTIGFNFVDPETGESTIISNSHSISKALEEDGWSTDTKWWIEFLEKVEIKKKPFNRFYIAKF